MRLSGHDALGIADSLFECAGLPLSRRRSWSAVCGHIKEPDSAEIIDDAVAVVFRAPRSYTGQDMVEFTCHGNPLVLAHVVQAARRSGARDAEPGEFTYRAYMNGRMDLMQCEAIADLIHANSQEALRVARRQQRGILSSRVDQLRSSLLDALAGLEYAIDFPDEQPEHGTAAALAAADLALKEINSLCEAARRNVSLRDGATVTIVGRPNVGKSSLLNALAGRQRSIVTQRPGTTRDVVEEPVRLEGAVVVLQDTAGIRSPRDSAERAGVDLATDAASCADLVLLVLDAHRGWTRHDQMIADRLDAHRTVWVWNKIDLVDPARRRRLLARSPGLGALGDVLALTATGGDGVAELAQTIARRAISDSRRESASVTGGRHVDLLASAARHLQEMLEGPAAQGRPEIAALELREAAAALQELTGRTTADDVIARVFVRFCIGK